MTKRVLVLGAMANIVEDVRRQLQMPEIEFIGGTSVDDVRSAFAQADINHVIIGGGLDLEDRLKMVQQVFQASDLASVHMKDHMSGPEGFLDDSTNRVRRFCERSGRRASLTSVCASPVRHGCDRVVTDR